MSCHVQYTKKRTGMQRRVPGSKFHVPLFGNVTSVIASAAKQSLCCATREIALLRSSQPHPFAAPSLRSGRRRDAPAQKLPPVTLSAAKSLGATSEILRFAQDDSFCGTRIPPRRYGVLLINLARSARFQRVARALKRLLRTDAHSSFCPQE